MSQTVVGAVRAWLETISDYPGTPSNRTSRALADGLTTTERLILMIVADFEQQKGGMLASQARIGKAAGRSRRQIIRVMDTLRTLGLLELVKPATQQLPAIYRITIPDVSSSVTPETNPDVTLGTSRCDITSTSSDVQMSHKRTEQVTTRVAQSALRKNERCTCRSGIGPAVPCLYCSARARRALFEDPPIRKTG